jgi:hypothetical protein
MRRSEFDEGGMRRAESVGTWTLRNGVLSYPAYAWGCWWTTLATFGNDHERLIAHVRGKRWAGRGCMIDLRELLRRAS